MPSTTRGSILISTANDIGEALVEKLGGVGYSPNEWKEKYNLCGIAPVDSAPALSVLADSAGTGDERGSILIATADAIGAILNKKYNVLRGFKPKEWASACRKMKALEEGSVASAPIASFSDGADTVPLTKCEVTFPASLDGYTAVECKQAGANLFNGLYEEGTYNQTTGQKENSNTLNRNVTPIRVAPSTKFCRYKDNTSYAMRVFYYDANMSFISSEVNGNVEDWVFTTPANCYYINFAYQTLGDMSKVSINSPYTETGYHDYFSTTYTASLGRTIYGGSADIITGEGTDENGDNFTFEPVKIDSFPGVNNIWNDCGNTAVEYYKAPTPYARKTATGGIANFSDQRTDLPLTKAIATIAPSIAGKSVVNLARTGVNLFDKNATPFQTGKYILSTTTIGSSDFTYSGNANYNVYRITVFPNTTYTMSKIKANAPSWGLMSSDGLVTSVTQNNGGTDGVNITFTTGASDNYLFVSVGISGTYKCDDILQIEVGSTVHDYEQYNGTTYTVELGETVYGGSVDFVSGEVQETYGKKVFDGTEGTGGTPSWTMISVTQGTMFRITISDKATTSATNTLCNYYTPVAQAQRADGTVSGAGTNVDIIDNRFSSVDAFKAWLAENPVTLVYELATPTEIAIPGRVISPIEGVNNYWNDAGGDTEIQYFEDET